MRSKRLFILLLLFASFVGRAQVIHLVFTSDAHFGLTRPAFRGKDSVPAFEVNKALVTAINSLPEETLPSGVDSGKKIGYIDYVIEGGDIANREEIPIQSASESWKQFLQVYRDGSQTNGRDGNRTSIVALPGNHDITNAVGFYRPMAPLTDASAMTGIYNMMMHPPVKLTPASYHYTAAKVNHSKTVNGVHLMFLTLWPDSSNRIWMEKDLSSVAPQTPVLIFTHDQPESEAKHFTNPHGAHDINATDKYENLLEEVHKDGDFKTTDVEQRGWCAFLKRHPNIKAYFHGNSNWSEFYDYHGPDGSVNLPVFRVDSPMKGKYSAEDESKLSFHFITIDSETKLLTVYECYWNKDKRIQWGQQRTVSLK